MSLNYHPRTGAVLMCNYDTGFKKPEMVKNRPVVVMSRVYRDLAIVVPLSCSEPVPFLQCHCEMDPLSLPTSKRGKRCWAKCDMASHVGFHRLDRVMDGKCPRTGKRIYVNHFVLPEDLEQIRKALRYILCL
jgi:uncharacterized protein YifN (PemK superfamily)